MNFKIILPNGAKLERGDLKTVEVYFKDGQVWVFYEQNAANPTIQRPHHQLFSIRPGDKLVVEEVA